MNNSLLGPLATYLSLGKISHKMYLPSIDDRWKYTYMPDIEEDKQKKESIEVSLDCTPCETKSENTMKYKVGDKVKVIEYLKAGQYYKTECEHNCSVTPFMAELAGHIYTIDNVDNKGYYTLKEVSKCRFAADMLEPVDVVVPFKENAIVSGCNENDGKLSIPTIEPAFKFL